MSGMTPESTAGSSTMLPVGGWEIFPGSREDPEFRWLATKATAGLARPPESCPAHSERRPAGLWTLVVLIFATSMLVVRPATHSASQTRSARVHDAAGFIAAERTISSAGRFLIPTINLPPTESAVRSMAESSDSALAAAAACAGAASEARDIAIDAQGVSGGSAGLMLALTVLDRLTPEDLLRGRIIAGTGEIHPDGRVGPVASVGSKAAAAEGAGADLFLVPREQAGEAGRATRGLHVLAVGTLSDAVRGLGGTGCLDGRTPSG